MKRVIERLKEANQSGVFQLNEKPEVIEQAADAAGLKLSKINLTRIRGKAALLTHIARILEFPNWFGKNWDALHDCLSDLSRTREQGCVILLGNGNEFAARYPQTFDTAMRVFESAAEQWRSAGKPFWVLIDGPGDWNSGLE